MKHIRSGSVLAITIAVLVAAAPDARAEIDAVVVHGKVPPREREVVTSAAKQVLLNHNWVVADQAFAPNEVQALKVCLDQDRPWSCIEPTATAKNVARLVVLHVEHRRKALLVTGQVLVPGDAVPPMEQRHCEPCSDTELDQAAKELTETLLNRMGPAPSKPATKRMKLGAVVVHGPIDDRDRAVVTSAVQQILMSSGWELSEMRFAPGEVGGVIKCLSQARPWQCGQPTAKAKGVERVAVVHAARRGKAVLVTGQVLVQSIPASPVEQRHCKSCSRAALGEAVKDMTRTLLKRMSEPSSATTLAIRTVPPGASITIDGKPAGASNATLPISAGPHKVQLRRPGYRTESRSLTVDQGQTTKLTLTLTPAGDRGRSRLLPALVAGAGALALAGGTLYSLTVESPDRNERKYEPFYLYSGPAIGVAVAGGLMLGLGTYLWFRSPKELKRRSAPTASLQSGGGVFGWSTSF